MIYENDNRGGKILRKKEMKLIGLIGVGLVIGLFVFCFYNFTTNQTFFSGEKKDTIKWVDFNVPYSALEKAMELDIDTYDKPIHMNWVDTLAYLGAIYGGDFDDYSPKDMDDFYIKLKESGSISNLTRGMKSFSHYQKIYGAILRGLIGKYKVEVPDSSSTGRGEIRVKEVYGLKGFSPIAKDFEYTDSDDFATERSYGYSRKHYGHDLLTATGTPIVATESGTVEVLEWDQYAGWQIGIRSFDKNRCYYYTHLRKDSPYQDGLYPGKTVTAGDVIGYSGETGYSIKENVNNVDIPNLHYGMQLIFDEKTKDSPNHIWIDMYPLTQLLENHKSSVKKDKSTGEYKRKYKFFEEGIYLHEAFSKTTISEKIVGVNIPVVMYHSLLKDAKMQNNYVIGPNRFEEDLKYLKKNGYTTVLMADLIDYVEKGAPLPKKPILLTFDDGYYNNYLYAFPLLKKHDMKAVISIIGKHTDEFSKVDDNHATYSHVTWKQIQEMCGSGLVEIQNHSYDGHDNLKGRKGVSQMSGESLENYQGFLKKDTMKLQEKIHNATGIYPTTFTYPFGAISTNSPNIIQSLGFKASLGCGEGISQLKTGDPDCLYELKRYLRPPNKSSDDFFDHMGL